MPYSHLYGTFRRYDTMPPAFQRSSNYHLGIHPLHPPMRLLAALRAAAHSNGGALANRRFVIGVTGASKDHMITPPYKGTAGYSSCRFGVGNQQRR